MTTYYRPIFGLRPAFVMDDRPDLGLRHAVFLGESKLTRPIGVSASDHFDLSQGEFRGGIGLSGLAFMVRNALGHSSRPMVTTFGHASALRRIRHVASLIAQTKMIRSNARWVVAVVEHIQAIWNGSVRQFPRNTMDERQFVGANADLSISVIVHGASPDPTRRPLPDLRPQSFRERSAHGLILSGNLGW